ncbi:4'-phosphopantetheinyl transferase superfamily protein [Bacillus pseudomycoides]|uniref:4'-phosphopantetheinyl transferase family protein n=1 Tax=Bacillus TaxID=1386 RepID=UPI00224916B1|nr:MULTISPECIES: 4'-phosphopantetheinyl transferase superfamily protein [Bacillus]MCX2829705.1 4'-phosphopantetheinyl transferase superfamily protein [Bacillus sp. DHT2]MDR4918764.1 4'-phosphopantetheinyl transferase superfamily protein [Bacillus pseudomycoides]
MEKRKVRRFTKNCDINLYWVQIPDYATTLDFHHKLNYLDEDERKVYEAYKVEEKRIEFLLGRVLVKKLLSDCLGLEPEKVRFIKNVYGRPYLHPSYSKSNLFFNLSHTKGVLACVVSPWEKVGIDIECTDFNAFEVIHSVFTEKEIEFLDKQLTADSKRQAFFRMWTRKEAVMKAEGKGFSLSPKSFIVPFDGERVSDGKYQYLTYSFFQNYLCSLAVEKKGEFECNIHRFSYEHILDIK